MVALVVEVEVTRMDTAVVTAMVEVTDIPTVTPTAPLGATAQDRTEVILVAQVTRWLT